MKKLISVFCLIFPLISYAKLPSIVALVNDKPITLFEFEARKKLVTTLHNIEIPNAAENERLNKEIINILIEEELLNQHTEKVGSKITEKEIDDAIIVIEERNKMPKGYLLQYLKSIGVSIDSFKAQIRGELIKYNIITSLSNSISVSPQELDIAIINHSSADIEVEAWVFSAKNEDDKTLQEMNKLKKRLTSCDKVDDKLYQNFAEAEKFESKLSAMPFNTQSIIKDTPAGKTSSVYQEDNKLKLALVCKKKLPIISEKEGNQITAFLSNNKMSKKAAKFFKDLRSRSYIKVNLPH